MLWVGLIITLVIGLISNNLLRTKIKQKFPKYDDIRFDWILIILLILSIAFTAYQHLEANKEKDILKAKVVKLSNKIILRSERIEKTSTGYTVLLRFEASRCEPLGKMEFEVHLPKDSESKILDFWPTKYGSPFVFQPNSLTILENGSKALLKYDLLGNIPAIQINVSKATELEIRGNYDLEPILINIEKNKPYPRGSNKRRVSGGSITF